MQHLRSAVHRLGMIPAHSAGACRISAARWASAIPPLPPHSDAEQPVLLTALQYGQLADTVLEQLCSELETLMDEHPDSGTMDVSLGAGVLTAKLGDLGTFVINKQTPNKQIWLSSPLSGPKRYDYSADGAWVYRHDHVALHTRLAQEWSELLRRPVTLAPPPKLDRS